MLNMATLNITSEKISLAPKMKLGIKSVIGAKNKSAKIGQTMTSIINNASLLNILPNIFLKFIEKN